MASWLSRIVGSIRIASSTAVWPSCVCIRSIWVPPLTIIWPPSISVGSIWMATSTVIWTPGVITIFAATIRAPGTTAPTICVVIPTIVWAFGVIWTLTTVVWSTCLRSRRPRPVRVHFRPTCQRALWPRVFARWVSRSACMSPLSVIISSIGVLFQCSIDKLFPSSIMIM